MHSSLVTLTRFGTLQWLLVGALTASACTSSSHDEPTPEADAGSDATMPGQQRPHTGDQSCTLNQDCTLVPSGCCASCNPDVQGVRAVLVRKAQAETAAACPSPVACGPCALPNPATPDGQLRAACVAGQCTAVDTRTEPSTACTADADCQVESSGCCNACGGNGRWFAFHKGATDPHAPECMPIPPCDPCFADAPAAYCAADGHCAVHNDLRNNQRSATCFSPRQALDTAHDPGALGCDCAATDAPVCATEPTGKRVALVCVDDGQGVHWQAVEDGACAQNAP